MSGDLVLLRILTVFGSGSDRDLLRQGAMALSVPIDVLEADSANVAAGILGAGRIDLVLLDSATAAPVRATIIAAARSAQPPAFVILVAASAENAEQSEAAGADAIVVRPTTQQAARDLVAGCIRVRLPTRVLVVDDSSTMRSIVRKILSASRFKFEIAEAQEGIEALKQIGSDRFDLVILDYNMPGFNGIETLSEIKRQHPRLGVVMMTSMPDEAVADRARAAGAAAFLKKPFYPSDIDAAIYGIFGLRVPAR